MELKGIVWLGTRTSRFDEMVAFAENVLGLTRKHVEPGFVVFALPNGDTVEVFDDQHPGGGHPDGVVAGFLVDDAERTAAELQAAGVAVSELGVLHGARRQSLRGDERSVLAGRAREGQRPRRPQLQVPAFRRADGA